jgi:hypothetical protein
MGLSYQPKAITLSFKEGKMKALLKQKDNNPQG